MSAPDLNKIAALFEQSQRLKDDILRLTFVRKHIAIPVVNKKAPGNDRVRALAGWDKNASQLGKDYVYKVIDAYVNIQGEKITGVPAAPGDANATQQSITAKVNRLLNYRALPRKIKGPVKNVPQTIPTPILRNLRAKDAKLKTLMKDLSAKYTAPVNVGKQEVEEEEKITIEKKQKVQKLAAPQFFAIDADDAININTATYLAANPVQKKIEILVIGKTYLGFATPFIIKAPSLRVVTIAVAYDICTLLGIDRTKISSSFNRITPDLFTRGLLVILAQAANIYKARSPLRSRANFTYIKRPVHFSTSDADGRAPIQPSLLAAINEIYPVFDPTKGELPHNTTMRATSLPPAIGTVDSGLAMNEVKNNPGFVNGVANDAKNEPYLIYNDPGHLLSKMDIETAEVYDRYLEAVAAANLMRTLDDKRTAEYGYLSDTYGAELMFAVIKTEAQPDVNDNSFTYDNLSSITMRSEEYAQFNHQDLDYTYCTKEGSPYFGKFIPAEHPSLAFMESPEYIPNACVLSAFISILRAGKYQTTYEDLILHTSAFSHLKKDKNRYRVLRKHIKAIRESPNPEIPINLKEFGEICLGIEIRAHVYTTDGVHLGAYGPSNNKGDPRNKNHRSAVNFIYSGGHLYYCRESSEIVSRWKSNDKPSLVPKMPDGIYNCTPMDNRIADAALVTRYNDIPDFMRDPTQWKNTIVFRDDVNLLDVFAEIRKTTGLITTPVIRGSNIRKLHGSHMVNGKRIKFSIVSNISERGVHISDPVEYTQYNNLCIDLNNIMIAHAHRSDYTVENLPVFKEAIKPFIGRLSSDVGTFHHIDCSKHYTAEAMRIPKFPVFGMFDRANIYNMEYPADKIALDDTTLYLAIFPEDAFTRFGPAAPPLQYWYYGYLMRDLLKMCRSERPVMIAAEFRPSVERENPLPQFFDDKEFNAPLKRAANETWGKLGIYEQSAERTLVYTNDNEAAAAMNAAKLIPNIKCKEYPLGDGIIALQIETNKVACINGFLPIKKAIYDSSRVSMLKLFDIMLDAHLTIKAINTDAIYYAGDATNLIIALDENNMIGKAPDQYNLSAVPTDVTRYPVQYVYPPRTPPLPQYKSFALRSTHYEDAWKAADFLTMDEQPATEFDEFLTSLAPPVCKVLVHGEFPGVGKSYTSLQLATRVCAEKQGTAIFCAPFNEHLLDNFAEYNKIGVCKTSASLFSMYLARGMTLAVRNEAKELVIPEGVAVIVFDEVYLNNVTVLTQIHRLMERRPDITYIFNGDYYGQMKAIQNYHNPDIIKHAIDQITAGGKEVILTEIKRNKNPRYKEFVIRLRETKTMNIDDRFLALAALFEEFGIKYVSDPAEIKNFDRAIAWRNITKMALNQLKCKKLEHGARIRCHDAFKCQAFNGIETRDIREKVKRGTIQMDFRRGDAYEVLAVEDVQIVLRPIDGTEHKCTQAPAIAIPRKYMAHFGIHFSKTAHGYQGATINGKVLICDLFTEHELKPEAYNYVALTRNTNLDDIYVYVGPADFLVEKNPHATHKIDKTKQICRECLRVLRAQEHDPKGAKCIHCDAKENIEHAL